MDAKTMALTPAPRTWVPPRTAMVLAWRTLGFVSVVMGLAFFSCGTPPVSEKPAPDGIYEVERPQPVDSHDQIDLDAAECLPDASAAADADALAGGDEECCDEVRCSPVECEGLAMECGVWPDGCGGEVDCGQCSEAGGSCLEGTCVCLPQCKGKQCGDDGCGGECGACNSQEVCFKGHCHGGPSLAFAVMVPGDSIISAHALVALPPGGSVLGGDFIGEVAPGDEPPMTSSFGSTDGYLIQLTSDGQPQHALAIGGNDLDRLHDLSAAPTGGYAVAGEFRSLVLSLGSFELHRTTDNCCTCLFCVTCADGFVARSNEDGEVVWATALGGCDDGKATAVAVGADGSLYVAGEFYGTMQTPCGTELAVPEGVWHDLFVMAFSADGECLWATRLGGDNAEYANDLAILDNGIVVVGVTESSLMTSADDFADACLPPSCHDGFVAFIGFDGKISSIRRMGGEGAAHVSAAVPAEGDSVVVAGRFGGGSFDFNGQPLKKTEGVHGIVSRLPAKGGIDWSLVLSGQETVRASSVARLGSGMILVGGETWGGLEAGEDALPGCSGTQDGLLLLLDGDDGSVLWGTLVEGLGNERVEVVAAAGTRVFAAGMYGSEVTTLNGIPLPPAAAHGAGFLLALDVAW